MKQGLIKGATLSDFQLPACISQSGEQVQLDAGLCAQVVLQVLSLLLHGGQRGQQHVRLLLHAAVLPQSLSAKKRETGDIHDGHKEEVAALVS